MENKLNEYFSEKEWSGFLKSVPKKVKDDMLMYMANKKRNWNRGKIRITPKEKENIINLQKALDKAGYSKEDFDKYITVESTDIDSENKLNEANNVVRGLAKESGKSEKEVEKLWKKAKDIYLDDKGKKEKDLKDDDYVYITGILKNMLGIKETWIKSFLGFEGKAKQFFEEEIIETKKKDEEVISGDISTPEPLKKQPRLDKDGNPIEDDEENKEKEIEAKVK